MEQDVGDSSESLSPQALISLRSVIVNPNTSKSTISSILEALTHTLQLSSDAFLLRHVLKLLTDISSHRRDLAPRVFNSVHSYLLSAASSRLAAETLSALASISDGNPSLISALEDIDDELFVSLCFGQLVSVRMWLLSNAETFGIRPHLLFTVFLGFTKDPYPYVRTVALNGLVGLCRRVDFDDHDVIEGCYARGSELLGDSEDYVRCAAVRAIGEWGRLLIESQEDINKRACSDLVFIKLCSMVRDMSMEVRVEAYDSLRRITMVSEDVLLQTLSKKVLGVSKDKKSVEYCADESSEISVAGAAGVFVHGIEDEFHEVRRSAIISLCSLTVLSAKFSNEVLRLLMDMLYDDMMGVRLKALETMHHIADNGLLKLQDTHMHAFLGTLLDSCEKIRSEARKILKLVKLHDMKLLTQTIDGLLKNLDMYPQDERDVFSTLFFIGQSYEKSSVGIIKRVIKEMDSNSGCKSDSASARLAAFLVLGFSLPLANKQNLTSIPPRIFSNSIIMLGRISHALGDVVDRNTLLAYLSQCSLLAIASGMEFDKGELFLHRYKQRIVDNENVEIDSPFRKSFQESSGKVSASNSLVRCKSSDDEIKSINLIFAKIKAMWPVTKSGCTWEVLRALRACKLEIATFSTESLKDAGNLEFTVQYIGVIKLLARAWSHIRFKRKLHFYETGELEILLSKLNKRLMRIRCTFIGLCGEDELRVLELVLLNDLLRLSKLEICCHLTTVKRLSSTIARVEFLHRRGLAEPSTFCAQIRELLCENSTPTGRTCYDLLDFEELIGCFSLEPITLSSSLRHIHAELDVLGNNPNNPLSFIPGLPVAIPLEITLHHVSSENWLWLRVSTSEESTQFVFLDPSLLKGSKRVNKFEFLAPVYITPRAVSFTVTVSIGMECSFENAFSAQRHRGPRHPLAFLCREEVVYLSLVSKD